MNGHFASHKCISSHAVVRVYAPFLRRAIITTHVELRTLGRRKISGIEYADHHDGIALIENETRWAWSKRGPWTSSNRHVPVADLRSRKVLFTSFHNGRKLCVN
jgi:hypothetical protein